MKRAPNDPRKASLTAYIWIGYWILLFIATHIPISHRVSALLPVSDLVLHFVAYYFLALLGNLHGLLTQRRTTSTAILWVCLYLAFAGLDEWLQSFVGRTMSLSDWLADAGGIAAATVTANVAQGLVRKSGDRTSGN